MSKIDKFFNILNNTKEPAYDVETNGLRWQTCYVCGYSVSDGKDSVYIPTRHEGGGNIDNVDAFERELSQCIDKHPGKIIGHNIKFDAHFSENHNIHLGNKVVDTMIMEALLDENRRSYSLENVCRDYKITPKQGSLLYAHIARKFGCKSNRESMALYYRLSGDDPIAVEYAEGDTLTTKQLYEAQKKELYAQNLDMVADVENQLSYVLQKMERRGISVDLAEVKKVKKEIDIMHEQAMDNRPIEADDDGPVTYKNINSKIDLREYFETAGITDWPLTAPSKTHPNGQPSFNKEFLSSTAEGLAILNARRLDHFKKSFMDVIDTHIYNSKIHTNFNQTSGEFGGTKTGRLSSSNPNQQQVPKRDKELGRIYRRLFIPSPGFFLIEFDYSQAEPRLYSHYSEEPALIEGYNRTPAIDMHSIAAEYMGVSRDVAKNHNLGFLYGMGPKKLASKLDISYEEAMVIYKKWQATFPRVSNYSKDNPGFTQQAAAVAEHRGYVKTILGRRARLDDARFSYKMANRIIQGGSADIMKWKLVEIDKYLVDNKLEDVCRMLLTIHDSIVFEIHDTRKDLIPVIQAILERVQVAPFNLKVPFIAEYKYGKNWCEATYGSAA